MKYRIHEKLSAGLLLAGLCSSPLIGAQDPVLIEQNPSENIDQQELINDMGRLIQARDSLYLLADTFIASLESAARLEEQRAQALSRGEQTAIPSNPELLARLTEVVIVLKDPRSIPALISVLGNGSTATPIALAEFGDAAVPDLIAIVSPPEGSSHQVYGGLLALRCMVEGEKRGSVSSDSIMAIKDMLSKRLGMKQEFVTNLWRDIDLAIALDDPALREAVETLASDAQVLIERGVSAPDLIQKTQSQARDRLNGIAAMPLCEDFRERINNRFVQ